MATEAEINPEAMSIEKTEEESRHLQVDLKKFQGDENGVEHMNTISQSNLEISKGESFLISPQTSSRMSEHNDVDDVPSKTQKMNLEEGHLRSENEVTKTDDIGAFESNGDVNEIGLTVSSSVRDETITGLSIEDKEAAADMKSSNTKEEAYNEPKIRSTGSDNDEHIEKDESMLPSQKLIEEETVESCKEEENKEEKLKEDDEEGSEDAVRTDAKQDEENSSKDSNANKTPIADEDSVLISPKNAPEEKVEKQIKEEMEEIVVDKDYTNREQEADDVTKAVILSEEVHKEVEKAVGIDQHIIEEESSTKELEPFPKGNETADEVKDYSSVSAECLKEPKEAENTDSTKDGDLSLVKEERGQEEDPVNLVSVQGENKEPKEKIENDISNESKLGHESDIEAVTEESGEASLNNTEEPESTLSISTGKTTLAITESDANQVKDKQLEDVSSELAPQIPTSENDEVQKRSLNVEQIEADITERDSDAVHIPEDSTDEAEKSVILFEKVDHELVEANTENSKTSNADEVRKIEPALDGDHVSEDKGTVEDEEDKEMSAENKILEDSPDAKETEEKCLDKQVCQEFEDAKKDDVAAAQALQEEREQGAGGLSEKTENAKKMEAEPKKPDVLTEDATSIQHTLSADKPEEETTSSASVYKEQDEETVSATDKTEEEKVKEIEILEKENERPQEPEAVVDQETAVVHTSIASDVETISTVEKPDEDKGKDDEKLEKEEIFSGQTLAEEQSDEKLCISKSATTGEETEQDKTNKEEILKDGSTEVAPDARTTEQVCSQKEKPIKQEAVAEDENASAKSEEKVSEEHKLETVKEDEKTEEEEVQNEDSDGTKAIEVIGEENGISVEEENKKGETLEEDKSTRSPFEGNQGEQVQEDEKVPEQTRDIEETSSVKLETSGKALLPETEDHYEKAITNEANESILNEVSKEEVLEENQVAQTSSLTSLSQELTNGSKKDEMVEDKAYEALEIKTCQKEELASETHEITEKQIVDEDETVEETATLAKEESSQELSETKGNEIIDQPEEKTGIASDKQIPREFYPIEITERMSSIAEKDAAAYLLEKVADAKESDPKVEVVEHKGETTTDNGEEMTKESMSLEDLTKVSSTGHVENSTKEILGMAAQDMIEEINVVQPQATELKEKELSETPVSFSEDVHKEDELKDLDIGDKNKDTLKAPAYETQTEELLVEAQNVVADDKTVKDQEQASTTAKEEIIGEADAVENTRASSIATEHYPIEKQSIALESSDKAQMRDLEPANTEENRSEAGVDYIEKKDADNSDLETAKLSLSDLLHGEVAKKVIQERELIVNREEPPVEEAETIQVKEEKTDEEKEVGDEHKKTDSGSDALVMVEAPRDADPKPYKKSHNILSGVGSKVKHSISKVKKAITGKSSHSKEAKPISPKGGDK